MSDTLYVNDSTYPRDTNKDGDFRKGRLPPLFQNVLAYHRIAEKIAGYK